VTVKAIFLDRDGVLTREKPDYVKTPNELEILPGIGPPLRALRERGFRLVIVTNQSVVGRRLATHDDLARIHEKLQSELKRMGCYIDAIYYCPHVPDERCSCRKPQPGLILKAAKDLGINVNQSWMIGDKEIDLEAAKRAGCRGVRVEANRGDLQHAVSTIIHKEETTGNGETA
jgi:histidinol-phosphate phosphatase family protein